MRSLLNFWVIPVLIFMALLAQIGNALAKGGGAVITDSKTVTKSFKVNPDARLNLSTVEADVSLSTWEENRVEVKITLTVEAYEQEELDKMFRELQVDMEGDANNVTVKSGLFVKREVSLNGKTRIKTNTQSIKLKSYSFKYEVKMPAGNQLNLDNRYGTVKLGSHKGRLNLKLYESKLEALELASPNAIMDLRYTSANLGTLGDLELNCYEAKISYVKSRSLKLNAKYTKLNAGSAGDVKLEAYESDLHFGSVAKLSGKHSYGFLDVEAAKEVSLSTYELGVSIGTADRLHLQDSRYSKISCGPLNDLEVDNSYENKMTFSKVKNAKLSAKYTDITIDRLSESLRIDGYELECEVGTVSKDFRSLWLKGQYTYVNIGFAKGAGYGLSSEITYGSVNYPKEKFDKITANSEGGHQTLNGRTSGYSGNSQVTISGTRVDVMLSHK